MTETKELVRRCAQIKLDEMDAALVDRVKYLVLDFIGVAARGSLSDSNKSMQRMITKLAPSETGAIVIGTDKKTLPSFAAMANGTAAHSLELDDVVNEASLHPAVAVMPAAFGAAHMSQCSGPRLMEGIVAGYETMIRLGVCLNPTAHYAQGFHPTGTCGVFGAAMAAGRVLGQREEELTNALGIAGSQAAGSMEFLANGAWTKRLHPGWAAHSGIVGAALSGEGFLGPQKIIEGRNGFLNAYSGNAQVTKLFDRWADPYKIMNTSIKPHACCRYNQGPIDGILTLMRENRIKPDDIAQVILGMLSTAMPIVVEPGEMKWAPSSIVDAQFSMPFGAAVAIVCGKASLDEYVEENLRSDRIKEMMNRIVCRNDPSLDEKYPEKWPATIRIHTKTQMTYDCEIEYPKGDPENPLNWRELIQKFQGLVGPVFEDQQRDAIIDKVVNLENEEDLGSFWELLSS